MVGAASSRLAFITIPKVDSHASVERVVAAIDASAEPGPRIPVHALIETHAGLRAVWEIAAHPRVQCLSFGLLDYVSGFDGAVPPAAMSSPGQFQHPLVRRAKAEISIAAHTCGPRLPRPARPPRSCSRRARPTGARSGTPAGSKIGQAIVTGGGCCAVRTRPVAVLPAEVRQAFFQ